MADLAAKQCVPCKGGIPPMPDEEIKQLLPQVPDWILEEGKLVRHFTFTNFKEAVAFTNKVADLAEAEGHHPDIFIHDWKHVKIILYTHKIGGLHENDFILASKIDKLL